MPELSIIIPTLNEARTLPHLLMDIARQRDLDAEILIADGGSTDNTLQIARDQGLRLVQTDAGRGRQMNAAARQAQGSYLLFIHADSRLGTPYQLHRALNLLRDTDGPGHRTAGHFPIRFDIAHPALAYRYMSAKSALNRRHCQNGDQGLLLHRAFFDHLGGFDESLPFFEDFHIAERIHTRGHWITLPGVLRTSPRRFKSEGLGRRYLLMGLMVTAEAAQIPQFLREAPAVYPHQAGSQRLLMTPYFRLFADIARRRGLRGSWQALLRIGRLSRLHWWQCFFWLDVTLGLKRRPCLRVYDRIIYPLTAHRLGDTMSGLLAWVVGMWLLRPYFRFQERADLKPPTPESCP